MRVYDLHIVGSKVNGTKIDSESFIEKFLLDLMNKIEMRQLHPPVIKRALEGEKPGVTGFLLISESHICIHTFTDENKFFADVASCKVFNPDEVKNFIQKKFNVKKIKTNFSIR